MRGRHPSGPSYVQNFPASAMARQRAQVILETLSGQCRVQEACRRQHVSEPRFHQLRQEMLQAGVQALEPQAPGRPAQEAAPLSGQVQALQEQVAQLQLEVRLAQAREELALVLPGVGSPAQEADVPGKKTPRRRGSGPRLSSRSRRRT